jgi:hypothetical protein
MGEGGGAYRVLLGKPEAKRPLGRHGRRWEDIIKMDIQEVRWRNMDWITSTRTIQRIFEKYSNTKFHENPSSVRRVPC